jgi:ABC-type branched-subunit amino acid transport system ATPase component
MVLNFGGKIADGSPQEVMSAEAVKKAYLGIEVEIG